MAGLAFPFYLVKRDVVPPIEPRRPETDVEHSWSLAFLACSLAPEVDRSLDVGKIAQFAIVHDLVEVFAGDTSPWRRRQAGDSKEESEAKALRHIEEQFTHFPWISRTIKEYESHVSNEAKFVWALDKVIVLILRHLDRGKSYVELGVTRELFNEQLADHKRKAHAHPAVGEYYDQLLECFARHPEYFARSVKP